MIDSLLEIDIIRLEIRYYNRFDQQYIHAKGTGCPFFERLIADCLDRTETAMTQRAALKAARLAIAAQDAAGHAGLYCRQEPDKSA